MIEQIEDFSSKLNLLRFSNLEIFLQHKIEVHQIGSPNISDAGISEAVCRLLSRS